MNIQLNPELERFVEEQVRAGRFSSRSEVLEAGHARLMLDPEPDELDSHDVKEIRESLAQMRSGQVVDWKEYSAKLRAKYLR
jgi:putative addiction module CopG family antidote